MEIVISETRTKQSPITRLPKLSEKPQKPHPPHYEQVRPNQFDVRRAEPAGSACRTTNWLVPDQLTVGRAEPSDHLKSVRHMTS
ncbi:hypothetical protein DY000_02052092 [Brassica cretica]|uniref:Uncharacterized protein n=1 Tax=Brassica cretica TaxID=69181 RepID=A0ABQ7AF00_BRACR|nr:hypothetical protein DY000_02052092 [Brassica cretica]